MILRGLLLFVPVSLILAFWVHASPLVVFAASAVAIVPLADWIRRATDNLASGAGPAIGGLVNVTFGSIAELILALFVLASGHTAIVKAQITGSLIATSLLGLGAAIIVGGWRRERQTFQRKRAGLLSSLLILSVIAILLPALFDYTERSVFAHPDTGPLDEKLSICVSVVLILVYLANLIYTLITHRDVFALRQSQEQPDWPVWKSLGILFACTAAVAVEADLIAASLQGTADRLGLTPWFLGIIVLATVGNAAEIIAAMYFARQDRMALVMGICIGSTVQVALLLAPLLVLISYFMGHPMNLVFANPLESIAVAGAVFAVNAIAADGETTWFEGVLLVAVYALFGLAFFFATP
ncbi:MAG: calcium/proton exchanger [Bryobacteraceae bacterium]